MIRLFNIGCNLLFFIWPFARFSHSVALLDVCWHRQELFCKMRKFEKMNDIQSYSHTRALKSCSLNKFDDIHAMLVTPTQLIDFANFITVEVSRPPAFCGLPGVEVLQDTENPLPTSSKCSKNGSFLSISSVLVDLPTAKAFPLQVRSNCCVPILKRSSLPGCHGDRTGEVPDLHGRWMSWS